MKFMIHRLITIIWKNDSTEHPYAFELINKSGTKLKPKTMFTALKTSLGDQKFAIKEISDQQYEIPDHITKRLVFDTSGKVTIEKR